MVIYRPMSIPLRQHEPVPGRAAAAVGRRVRGPLAAARTVAALGLLLAACTQVEASSFDIAPIRAELNAGQRTEALTLTNEDDAPVVVEVRLLAWSQSGGEERLEDTRDLLVTPPVLQVPAHGEQIVRVALRGVPDAVREMSYRLVLQEVPQAAPSDFTGLRVALRLSVPVFVAPAHGKARGQLEWEMHALPDGKLEVAATNRGSGHVQVIDFELDAPQGAAGATGALKALTPRYVLPGSRIVWVLKPDAGNAPSGQWRLRGHSDQGELAADVPYTGV